MGCCCSSEYSKIAADDGTDDQQLQPPQSASEPCDKAGWMKMKIGNDGDWSDNLWFGLRGMLLYVYANEHEEKQTQCISLSGCMCVVHDTDDECEERLLSHMFEISSYSDDRLFSVFEVETEQLKFEWINKISGASLSNSHDEYSVVDCYKALGLPEDSSYSQVKKAFHKIARKEHPDKVT
jgi:hypothetical protein